MKAKDEFFKMYKIYISQRYIKKNRETETFTVITASKGRELFLSVRCKQ